MVNAVFCLLFILILVCAGSDITKLMIFGLFLILNLIFPLRGRPFLWRVRRFVVVPFVTVLFIVGINLCVPFGKVLLKSGFLTITEGALREGIKRAVLSRDALSKAPQCVRANGERESRACLTRRPDPSRSLHRRERPR